MRKPKPTPNVTFRQNIHISVVMAHKTVTHLLSCPLCDWTQAFLASAALLFSRSRLDIARRAEEQAVCFCCYGQ